MIYKENMINKNVVHKTNKNNYMKHCPTNSVDKLYGVKTFFIRF